MNPELDQVTFLENKFDEIFQQNTCYVSLNLALKRIHENKSELLVILKRPDIPLHNNQSESDIREKVQRKKDQRNLQRFSKEVPGYFFKFKANL